MRHGRQSKRTNQNHLRFKASMPPQEVMEMVCGVNQYFKVVLFHDVTKAGDIDKIDDLVAGARERFTERFKAVLAEAGVQEMLTTVYQSNPSDERNAVYAKIHDRFAAFGDELDSCIETIGSRAPTKLGLARTYSSSGNMMAALMAGTGVLTPGAAGGGGAGGAGGAGAGAGAGAGGVGGGTKS